MSIDVVLDAIYLGIGWSNILIKRFDVSIFKFSFKTLLHFNSITSRGKARSAANSGSSHNLAYTDWMQCCHSVVTEKH